NGLISVKEASEDPVFRSLFGNITLVLAQNVASVNGTGGLGERLGPQYDMNNDTLISINDELKPRQIDKLKSFTAVVPNEKCSGLTGPCPIWLHSQYSLLPNLDIIDKVPFNISVLILQGENDSDTPIQQALLLQQKLTELRHPDHALITYPNLGHLFYPSSQWVTTVGGPIEKKVLEDLFKWITDPDRNLK